MKTSELTGAALNWAVAKAMGGGDAPGSFLDGVVPHPDYLKFYPSTDWAQGGPIIERGKIIISPDPQHGWRAMPYMDLTEFYGPTPLIAAMRCHVASEMGNEIEIPKELQP